MCEALVSGICITTMQRSIARHLPLITSRIEFRPLKAAGSQPVITPRIDFDKEWGLQTDNTALNPTATVDFDKNLEDVVIEDDEAEDVEEVEEAEKIPVGKCNNSKIRKPQGEPGHPNSGGYSIEAELRGWSPDLLENVTVSFRWLAFNTASKSFSAVCKK
jgi:hypothetical protein